MQTTNREASKQASQGKRQMTHDKRTKEHNNTNTSPLGRRLALKCRCRLITLWTNSKHELQNPPSSAPPAGAATAAGLLLLLSILLSNERVEERGEWAKIEGRYRQLRVILTGRTQYDMIDLRGVPAVAGAGSQLDTHETLQNWLVGQQRWIKLGRSEVKTGWYGLAFRQARVQLLS